MMVRPFLTILTDIPPGARGILSLFTPEITGNVDDELPHFSVTLAAEGAKTTAHIVSWILRESQMIGFNKAKPVPLHFQILLALGGDHLSQLPWPGVI